MTNDASAVRENVLSGSIPNLASAAAPPEQTDALSLGATNRRNEGRAGRARRREARLELSAFRAPWAFPCEGGQLAQENKRLACGGNPLRTILLN
jgi:hypothetical protein